MPRDNGEYDRAVADPLFDLEGRVAVVTGGMGQLGAALAAGLAERGMRVAILDLETAPRPGAAGLATALEDGSVRALACDVTDRRALEAALALVEADWGVPQLLVNAAAIDAPPDAPTIEVGPFEDVPLESLERVVHVNVVGVVVSCQVVGGAMARAGRGSIVNVGSVYGLLSPDQGLYDFRRAAGETFFKPVAYSVSKSALLNLTRYLATYWGRSGVRVNTLTPHGIENGQPEPFVEAFATRSPLGRLMDVSEALGAVVFPRVRRLVLRHRRQPPPRRRLVGLVIASRGAEPRRGRGPAPARPAPGSRRPGPATATHLCRLARSEARTRRRRWRPRGRRSPRGRRGPPSSAGSSSGRSRELLRERRDEASELVAAETGKSLALAQGETDAAVEMGFSSPARVAGRTAARRRPPCRTARCSRSAARLGSRRS